MDKSLKQKEQFEGYMTNYERDEERRQYDPQMRYTENENKFDDISRPEHYCAGFEIEPLDFIVENQLDFLEGNIIKYISRHRNKNGAEDIIKIIHYAHLILELEYGEK